MLLREDVVLGRAGRVSSSSRWRDVGVARQGVGGCCLGGHAFLVRVDWRIYLARRATDGWLAMLAFFYDICCWSFKVSREPAPRAMIVRWQRGTETQRSGSVRSDTRPPKALDVAETCDPARGAFRLLFTRFRLQQNVIDPLRRLKAFFVIFLVCITSTLTCQKRSVCRVVRL